MTRAVVVLAVLALLLVGTTGRALGRQPAAEPPAAEQADPAGEAGGSKRKRAREAARRAAIIDAVIGAAESYLGLPYRLGREGPDIFDCSGLVYRIFADTGHVERIGARRMRAAGYMRWFGVRGRYVEDVTLAERGDLVIYDAGKHIGIYLGKDKVISALIEGVTLHRIDGITLELSGILKVDWAGEGGEPLPHPDAVAAPAAPTDDEAPASLVPPLPWLAPLADEAPGEIVIDAEERVDMRTASSRTFATDDGTFVTELFGAPIFYLPDGAETSARWQPIDLRLTDGRRGGLAVQSAPVALKLTAADAADGFVRVAAGDLTVALHVPRALMPRAGAALPQADVSRRFADYHRLLRGNVGMRVFPRADGVKTFLVLAQQPRRGELTFTVDAPALTLAAETDGSVSLRDPEGAVVGRFAEPLVLDSSDETGEGGGLAADMATLAIVDGEMPQLSITIDDEYLAGAHYPVYVDLSLVEFPTPDLTARQTFASSRYPTTGFGSYQRPEAPAHSELWHGRMPGTQDYSEAFVRFADLLTTFGGAAIESASLRFYPYWQYDLDGARPTWVSRVAQDWQPQALNWDLRPAVDAELGRFQTRAGQWSDIDVTTHVVDTLSGLVADYGFRLHADGGGRGSWKRIVAGADADPLALSPRLVVRWSGLRPTAAPGAESGAAGDVLAWAHPALAPRATHVQAQLSTDGFTTVALEIELRGADAQATTWQLPAATLADGVEYAWRVRAKYGKRTPWSGWSEPIVFVHRAPGSEAAPSD